MSSSPPQPRRSLHLPILLTFSVVANFALAWRLTHPPEPAATAAPAGPLLPFAALGSNVAENNRIADLKWSEPQFNAFVYGLRASYEGRGFPLDEEAQKLRADLNARVQEMLEAERPDPTENYFKLLRDKEGVQRTASNLHYRITVEGEGARPTADSTVVVSYAARTPDGNELPMLASTRLRVRVADLLPGLAEGVQLLKPGGKALVYVPATLSFPEAAWPADVPPGMPIAFFLELHEVIDP